MSPSPIPASFRPDFVWGAATASYQIEGAHHLEGKGLSIWDQFSHEPDKILRNENGDVACDHYQRMASDVALMADLGLKAYRFSVSWPRILPEGRGRVNPAGLSFYDRLVDQLLARKIVPWVTLFHWDYPLALQQKGGWLHSDSPAWFADFATVIADKLGDRVQHWITLNEPQVFVKRGYESGIHAPGIKLPVADLVRLTHQVLLAHGRSVQILRERAALPACIGCAPAVPLSVVAEEYRNDPEVVQQARDDLFGLPKPDDFTGSTPVWNDAALLGRYPDVFVQVHHNHLPASWMDDLAIIAQPLDFCGMNIYAARGFHKRDSEGRLAHQPESALGKGYPRTLFGWPVTPESLYWGPRFFHERYRIPIVITENGMSGHDWVMLDGRVHDQHRIDFTARYLRALRRAVAEGVDVRGYFHWSFMDNFEWAEGYKQRFGLVHVDFKTQQRTPKDSAFWYRDVIASNGEMLEVTQTSTKK